MSWQHFSMTAISQLLLTRFWPNFKGSVPETIFNRCQLSRWHLSKQHMSWWHLSISVISQLILPQFWPKALYPNFSWGLNFVRHLFLDQTSFDPNTFWTQKCIGPNYFRRNIFCTHFLPLIFLDLNFFYLDLFGHKFFYKTFYWP